MYKTDLTLAEQARLVLSLTDLTSLNDNDTNEVIDELCKKANSSLGQVAAVCVYLPFAAHVKQQLSTTIPVATVINFPQGGVDLLKTRQEFAEAAKANCDEIDFVFPWRKLCELTAEGEETIDPSKVKNDPVYKELYKLVEPFFTTLKSPLQPYQPKVKVIIESGSLNQRQIALASQVCIDFKLDFIKTSTGKHGDGASLEAAKTIFAVIKANNSPIGFKASGGIKTVAQAMEYIQVAAQTLGAEFISPKTFRFGASGIYNDIKAIIETGKATTTIMQGY